MLRSLWTAASGMIAQQNNVDTIANNLANVNTTGYKSETAEFKSLLYQELQTKTTSSNGDTKPIGAAVGLGVRNSTITSHFKQGAFQDTGEQFDIAIQGDGFFQLRNLDGNPVYTRNGDFMLAINSDGDFQLSNAQGLAVMDMEGNPIIFDEDTNISGVSIDLNGMVVMENAAGVSTSTGIQLGIYQFTNPSGLTKLADTLYEESAASGVALQEAENQNLSKSTLKTGYLEMSSVQVADEMVSLIVAQRAYELNSKAITTSDEMMQTANNLKS